MLVARSCKCTGQALLGTFATCGGRLERLRPFQVARFQRPIDQQKKVKSAHTRKAVFSVAARQKVVPAQTLLAAFAAVPLICWHGFACRSYFQLDSGTLFCASSGAESASCVKESASSGTERMPAYWLLKSEPGEWSWQNQVQKGVESWDGVRNAQAQKNLRTMKCGDLCFFYHSVKEKAVVGVVSVCKEIYPDPSDESGKWGMVDVKAVEPLVQPVTLAEMKADPVFEDLILLRQSRLSVVPLQKKHWDRIHELGSVKREEEPKKPRKTAKKGAETAGQDGAGQSINGGVVDIDCSAVAKEVGTKIQPGKRKSGKLQGSKGSEQNPEEVPTGTGKGPKRKKGLVEAPGEKALTAAVGNKKQLPQTVANLRRSGRSKAKSA